jgi:hypothetical protein
MWHLLPMRGTGPSASRKKGLPVKSKMRFELYPLRGVAAKRRRGAVHRTFSARTPPSVHLISRKQEDGSCVSVVLAEPSQGFVSTDLGSCRRSGEATDCLCTIWFLDGALDATWILYRLLVWNPTLSVAERPDRKYTWRRRIAPWTELQAHGPAAPTGPAANDQRASAGRNEL